jgi:glutathione S-transferase
MKLYSHSVSPFARKARIIAHELGIKLEIVPIESARKDTNLRQVNPLKQIPVLVLDDGSSLFDSPVICEYLNHTGGGKFFPGMSIWRHNSGRWKALGLQALGDGIADAAVAWRYEMTEPEDRRNPDRRAAYTFYNITADGNTVCTQYSTTSQASKCVRAPRWKKWSARRP